jgi:hypothetical protein
MTDFELVFTLAASILASRVAPRWAQYDLVPWVRWLQGNAIPDGTDSSKYLKHLKKYGL